MSMPRKMGIVKIVSAVLVIALSCLLTAGGCGESNPAPKSGTTGGDGKPSANGGSASGGTATSGGDLKGSIKINGSSTVYLITQAVAEEFMGENPGVQIEVGRSGTGGGFKEFVKGGTDINDSSRTISEKEVEQCKTNGVEYLELKVAIDGLTVVVNPKNDWCECLTVEQLKSLWEPDSKVKKWNQLNPDWPDEDIRLYGADSDSGTFDYFTEAIVGKAKSSRTDYTASADDNVLVVGVEGDKYALGYFGFAYYVENQKKLKAVGVAPAGSDAGDKSKCVKPTIATIESGAYAPLSRPLFLHVNKKSLERPEVIAFLKEYLGEEQKLVSEVGYIRLNEAEVKKSQETLQQAIAGSSETKP